MVSKLPGLHHAQTRKKTQKLESAMEMPEMRANNTPKLDEPQLLKMINQLVTSMPREKVFYELKKLNVTVKAETVDVMCVCLALHTIGLPITEHLVNFSRKKAPYSSLQALHTLGDRHILILKRRERQRPTRVCQWTISQLFLKALS
jgi:hypothetical protein